MKTTATMRPVLIVDDSADDLFLSQRALRKAGVENPIVTVSGGREAIHYLRQSCPAAGGRRSRKPSVVFLDIRMPDVDGFQVLRWTRKKKALRKTKVIMLSSSDNPHDQRRAQEFGADGFLVKYPEPDKEATVLREVLERVAAPVVRKRS